MLAKIWLQECFSHHSLCKSGIQAIGKRQLPKRLVFLRYQDNVLKARLIEEDNFSVDVRYFTLSHCWGQDPFYTFTSDNFPDFLDSIPLDHPDFNATFRDAM